MNFLYIKRKFSCLNLLDKVKSADIRESLNIKLRLLRLEISQLRWYGLVTQISQEKKTAKKLLCSTPIGRRPIEAVPELDGEITWKILVGLALASKQSIYPLLQRIEMLGGSNLSSCSRDPPLISG